MPNDQQTAQKAAERLLDWQKAARLSDKGFAAYLGVSENTLRNWTSGKREPNDAAVRLFDVLQTIEALAPDLAKALRP